MCDLTNPAFTNEDKAREFLEASRWPDGAVCPHCGQLDSTGTAGDGAGLRSESSIARYFRKSRGLSTDCRSHAANSKQAWARRKACELVHICPPSSDTECRLEDQAMPRIPEWLTVDLLIIAVAMVFIGAGVLIAP